jgi:hypothetical protein
MRRKLISATSGAGSRRGTEREEGLIQPPLIFPKFLRTPACTVATRAIGPRIAGLRKLTLPTGLLANVRSNGPQDLLAMGDKTRAVAKVIHAILVAGATLAVVVIVILQVVDATLAVELTKNLAVAKGVALLWLRRPRRLRHALTRGCVCPVGQQDTNLLTVRN